MYQALYRRFRPGTFDEILGQDHIVETIKNQIINDNIGHAYLFSGTRGTGKTSTAKIFSRAVNCLAPENGNPCNECEVCLGILDESIMDVVEMDAASNRGVNDIRELRDKVVYPPSKGRYKVYIIDEVHMLTQEAFNALLKTLEEPPSHLIFILATTEPERIPDTILSRCQRFDFKRITTADIIENMKNITESLGVSIEDEALTIIARNADGGMRDALSLLDQCISFTKGDIRYEDAISILGIVNIDTIFEIVDNIIDESIEDILLSIEEMLEAGRDVNQFLTDIIKHFRDLMVVKTFQDSKDFLAVSDEIYERYLEQAEKYRLNYIVRILDILTEMEEKLRFSTQPKTLLEMAMIRIVNEDNLSLEERVEKLEKQIESGNIQVKTSIREPKIARKPEARPKPRPSTASVKSKAVKESKQVVGEEKEVKEDYPSGEDLTLDKVKSTWSQVLEVIRKNTPSVAGVLIEGEVVKVENAVIYIEFGEDFGFHMNAAKNNTSYIEEVVSEFYSRDLKVAFDMEGFFGGKKEESNDDEEENLEEVLEVFGEDRVKIIEEGE